ncbi:MAG: amidohydrolase [Dokdonella sp.]|uniref:amidohydrolase n=1 Tax=Dokdonella sp. TaxID=2291710 RepID=UPI003BB156DB
MRPALLFCLAVVLSGQARAASELSAAVKNDYDHRLAAMFDWFHRHPELSYLETATAARMARELRRVPGMTVTEKVGGTGVVGVLRNDEGPTVLIRADMDGLPIKEASGLANASTAVQVGIDGVESPVMHACGHDTHITALLGTATRMASLKKDWRGTLVFVVQPAEERIAGARKMLEDGLYTRFPKPDYALAFHVDADSPTGALIADPGIVGSSSDTIDIIVHGVGAHGASPQQGKDPIVMGAEIVLALQTLVSREISPLSPGVVTVGAFHSGSKHNIISDRAVLQLTVRSDDEAVRKVLLDGIKRIAENVGRMNGMPEDRLPEVNLAVESTPVTLNDPALTARMRAVFVRTFGEETLKSQPRTGMGAEDFAYFVQPELGVAGFYFNVGGTPQAAFDAARAGGPAVAGHHSARFKIDPEPSIRLGIEAMTVAALDLLKPASAD